MKFKLSRSQWETIGKTAGWTKKAQSTSPTDEPQVEQPQQSQQSQQKGKNILFVCTGNTCRSPMAEGIAKKLLGSAYNISSAGIDAKTEPASTNAIEAAKLEGVDISAHISRRLTPEMINAADYIFAMGGSHMARISTLVPGAEKKAKNLNIFDPYGGDLNEYIEARDGIINAINTIVIPTVKV